MMKNRNEVIEYVNDCINCYGVVVNEDGECKVLHVPYKRVTESIVVLAVDNKEIEAISNAVNQNISVVFWDKIHGYQLKGKRISREEAKEHCYELDKLREDVADAFGGCFIMYSIDDVYNVTPGKYAGKLVG